MTTKKALVLAGGFPQIQLIHELKSRGYFVVLADWNDDPVAKDYCDLFYKESTLNVEGIKTIAINEKVDFIITVCTDQALLTVAKISEDLGLPCYLDYKTALNVTNKQYMKAMFVKHNIPTAKHKILDELHLSDVQGFRYPIITKPVDCNSSKGVKKAFNFIDLEKFFYEAKKMSRTNTAIIEEYIDGPEVSVDVYVQDGKAIVLSTSNSEKIKDDDKFVIFRSIYPAYPSILEKIKIIAQRIADAFQINNSPMLIQLLVHGNDAYVIEFSARTGGGVKYLLVKEISGFDVIKAVVDLTEGKRPKVALIKPDFNYLTNEFIYCKEGTFDHLEGFEELKKNKIVKDYYLFKTRGACFNSIMNSGDRIAGFTLIGDTPQEMAYKHNATNSSFKVIDCGGNDIARHDLLIDLDYNNRS